MRWTTNFLEIEQFFSFKELIESVRNTPICVAFFVVLPISTMKYSTNLDLNFIYIVCIRTNCLGRFFYRQDNLSQEILTKIILIRIYYMYFFFFDELRKFTISDFPKQTHLGYTLITLFFSYTL